ncbi:MAG: hypothetical protein ABI042_06930 [Verrucomicrobiota bacterium]
MTTSSTTAAPRKKRNVGRIIGIVLCILILPIVIGYFVVTSTGFFKKFILPRVGASMNSTVTVADAKISPFSQVVLKQLTVTPHGKETLLKADELRARYSLMDIIKGKITVHEATLISPVITIFTAADGSSNLDPITKQDEKTGSGKNRKVNSKSERPPNLNIQNVSLQNALVQQTKNLPGGGREFTEISQLNLSMDRLGNGQPGKMTVAANVRMERVPSAGTTNATPGSLQGKLAGAFDYKLTADAQPESAKGNLRLDVSEAKGDMAELAQLGATLNCDLTPSDIRDLSLQFSQGGQALGALRASGPFSFANREGKLKMELSSIDRRVLNLAGASKGIDFNSTIISSTNEISISQKGAAMSINGELSANKLSLTKKADKQTTPTLELRAAYQVSVDETTKSALIQKFDVNGTQNQQKILTGSLSQPMAISWGGSSGAPENATLQLALIDLNLADWKAFASDMAPSGKLNTTLNVVSQEAGKRLSLDFVSRMENFSAKFGSNQISNADVELKAKAEIADMKKVLLSRYSAELSQNKQSALTLSGSGTFDLESKDADIKAAVQGSLASLFKLVVLPEVNATSGTLSFDGQVTQRKDAKSVKGNFALTDFSGSYSGSPLDRFGAKFDADLEMNQQNLQIRKLSGEMQQAGQPGGTFDVKGNYNSEKKTGDIEMKLANVNENALRPFLAKSLGEKQLVSISVNGNTTAHLRENESSFKGNIDLKNLVVRDPKKSEADAPLAAQVQLDGAMRKDIFDLKQFQVTLSPTARAKNQLNITGQLDLSKTNAMKGKLIVQSDSFDVTPFYDLSAKPPQATAAGDAPSSSPANQPAAQSNEEPKPMKLPVELIVAEIQIAQFYLREIEIKDWRGTAKIEGSRIFLNPFELKLNNARVKVNADLNLGVKGYAYDFSASLDGVPLEPLANSFMPDQKGAYQGTIFANAKFKGEGTTGVNLKRTLSGQANLNFTNANIKIVGPKFKKILVPIAAVLQIPEIAETPINWIDAKLDVREGNIHLENFAAVSASYRGTVRGNIPIAGVLTNSPLNKIPVGFELSKALAEKAPQQLGLANGATSADGQYVKLPNLIMLVGTLGDPQSEFDKKGLTALALQTGAGFIKGDAGKILQGLGGILGGNQTKTNATTNPVPSDNQVTNNAAPNQPLNIDSVLDLFKKKKKK